MAGLLGNGWDDPQSSAMLALAGGLLRGDMGGGLLGANGAYQSAQDSALKRQLTGAQLGEYATKNQLEQFQLQRLKDWQAQVTGGGAPASAPAPVAAPQINPANSIGGVVPQFSGPLTVTNPTMQGQQSPQAPASGGFPFPLRGMSDAQTRAIAGSMSPEKYMELYAQQSAPQTDIEKLMAAQGIPKDSPLGRTLLQTATAKANYQPPVNARPGSILRDPYTNKPVAFNPHIPDGSMPTFDASGNVTNIQPISGAYPAMAAAAGATEFGKAEATPTVAYDASGNPVFSTKGMDVRRAGGGLPGAPRTAPMATPPEAAAEQANIFNTELQRAQERLDSAKTPAERERAAADIAGLQREMKRGNIPMAQNGGLSPQQRPGVVQGATLSQDELSKKGASLIADNGQTNTVISRLQNIKMLAPGAITGAESSRRDFFNGLLSLANIKGAEDAKTASDLVDKNSAQIVSALRMGQGGAGTDALQTLLSSANPNRHMSAQAIAEAADQLIASQRMIQDKAKLLQPHYMGRDPVSYGSKELQFDQNADPRIWQMHSMSPQQQAAYVKSLPPEVAADLLKKRQAMKQLGVF